MPVLRGPVTEQPLRRVRTGLRTGTCRNSSAVTAATAFHRWEGCEGQNKQGGSCC